MESSHRGISTFWSRQRQLMMNNIEDYEDYIFDLERTKEASSQSQSQ